MTRFEARIEAVGGGGHYVVVPEAAAKKAGLKYRMRVRGTVGGVAYRSSLMIRGGVFHMGVHKATLEKAKLAPGDRAKIAIEEDDEPLPEDTVPPLLAAALKKDRGAKAAWDKLAPSHRREHVRAINDAKKEETRQARVARALEMLRAKK
jgi:hypothetical protein